MSASESRHAQPSRPASSRPTVVLPAPISPVTTTWRRGSAASRTAVAAVHSAAWTPRRRSRRPPSSASWAAASSGGCSALAARAMGYRIAVLDPDPDCPAAAVADQLVDRVVRRRRGGAAAGRAERRRDLRAGARRRRRRRGARGAACPRPARARGPLLVTQDRLAERRFVEGAGRRGRAVARGPVRGGGPGRGRRARPAAPAQAADRRLRRSRAAPDRGAGRARRRLGAARPAGRRRRCSPSASSTSRPSCRSWSRARLDGDGRGLPDRPEPPRRRDPRRVGGAGAGRRPTSPSAPPRSGARWPRRWTCAAR